MEVSYPYVVQFLMLNGVAIALQVSKQPIPEHAKFAMLYTDESLTFPWHNIQTQN